MGLEMLQTGVENLPDQENLATEERGCSERQQQLLQLSVLSPDVFFCRIALVVPV
jgi:hypothetical protein